MQKQNASVSIATLFQQHGADDPKLQVLWEFLDALIPSLQQSKQCHWESASKTPLPREPPYATDSSCSLLCGFQFMAGPHHDMDRACSPDVIVVQFCSQ
jgi:hypothetical protein